MAVFAFVVTAVLLSPLFRISRVDVVGNNALLQAEILRAANLEIGSSIFAFSARNVSNNIAELPYIHNVSITRELPNVVSIEIHERVAIANIQNPIDTAAYILTDGVGFALELRQNPDPNLPIILGLDLEYSFIGQHLHTSNPTIFSDLLLLSQLFSTYEFFPRIIDFSNPRDIIMRHNNFEIDFGSMDEADRKVRYLQAVVQNPYLDRGYIDIRNPEINPRLRVSR